MDPNGKLVYSSFNANDFTLLFWIAMAVIAVGIAIFNLRYIEKRYDEVLYITFAGGINYTLTIDFYLSMQWR